jgi:hypothetical protein
MIDNLVREEVTTAYNRFDLTIIHNQRYHHCINSSLGGRMAYLDLARIFFLLALRRLCLFFFHLSLTTITKKTRLVQSHVLAIDGCMMVKMGRWLWNGWMDGWMDRWHLLLKSETSLRVRAWSDSTQCVPIYYPCILNLRLDLVRRETKRP